MSSVSKSTAAANHTLHPVAWAALSKASGNEPWRDELNGGSAHTCVLQVSGKVNGKTIPPYEVKSTVTVGHDSTRSSSTGPRQELLVATILSKLNDATRNAILRDLPAIYADNNCNLPEVDKAIVAETDAMLKKLRASKQIDVRGSVSVNYSLEATATPDSARKAKSS